MALSYHEQRPALRARIVELCQQCKRGQLPEDEAAVQMMALLDNLAPTTAQQYVAQQQRALGLDVPSDTRGLCCGFCSLAVRWLYILLYFCGYTAVFLFVGIGVAVVLRYSLPIFGHVARFLWQYT